MPLVDWNSKATFDQWYDTGTGIYVPNASSPTGTKELRLGYNRFNMMKWALTKAIKIRDVLQFGFNDRILVAGVGFGWLAEALEALGYTNIISIDDSTWVQANKDTTEEIEIELKVKQAYGVSEGVNMTPEMVEHKNLVYDGGVRTRASRGVLNNNMSTGKMRKDIRDALGGIDPDIVLTDEVLESLSDNECTVVSGYAHTLTPNVYHLVQATSVDPAFNVKTLDQWKALLPNDTIVHSGTFETR